jgi:hypothetical protein
MCKSGGTRIEAQPKRRRAFMFAMAMHAVCHGEQGSDRDLSELHSAAMTKISIFSEHLSNISFLRFIS